MLAPQPVSTPAKSFNFEPSDKDSLNHLVQYEKPTFYNDDAQQSHSRQLQLGMDKTNVEAKLGTPVQREVAGNPQFENERWTYIKAVPTRNGPSEVKKVIYFEKGSVVGWESQ